MKLIQFMSERNLDNHQVVEMLKERANIEVDHTYISHLKHNRRTPSLPVALAIEKATKGRVKCGDWV